VEEALQTHPQWGGGHPGAPPHTHPIDALHAEILGTPLITWYGEYCWNVVIGNLFKAER